jgi:modulator of FtsH protease
VYLWLMGGIVVAGIGAIASPIVIKPLAAATGRFFPYALMIGQLISLIWAQSVSRRRPQNRIAFGIYTFISGVIAGLISMLVAQQTGLWAVMAAFGMTGAAFLTLTATAFVTKKDFSFLRSFVLVGLVIAFVASLIGWFVHLPMLHIVISAVVVIACSAKILWDTSAMLRTSDMGDAAAFALSLFVSLYLIFIHLLNLLGGRRD